MHISYITISRLISMKWRDDTSIGVCQFYFFPKQKERCESHEFNAYDRRSATTMYV